MKHLLLFALVFTGLFQPLFAQETALLPDDSVHTLRERVLDQLGRIKLEVYGSINYQNYDWQTFPGKRSTIDLERFVLEPSYRLSPKLTLRAEIEFEHGGTGASVEFDRFEEFGEFEYEIEKGGEILLEQLNLDWKIKKWLNLKIGHFEVPIGMMPFRDEPTDYSTVTISEMETSLLPVNWNENGVSLYGNFGKNRQWYYNLSVINGLDNSAFSSAGWVQRGSQKRFEMVNAENMALVGRFDYVSGKENRIGFSGFIGNSTGNRPKPDLNVPAWVGIADFHFLWELEPFEIAGMAMYGTLSNSEAVSDANRNLSNNLNVKRTPVAAAAAGAFLELGIEVFDLLYKKSGKHPDSELYLFGRYDYYDSMYKTEGEVFNNPRWERHTWTAGLNYDLNPYVRLKAQYAVRKLGIPSANLERSFGLGLGFYLH